MARRSNEKAAHASAAFSRWSHYPGTVNIIFSRIPLTVMLKVTSFGFEGLAFKQLPIGNGPLFQHERVNNPCSQEVETLPKAKRLTRLPGSHLATEFVRRQWHLSGSVYRKYTWTG